MPPVPPNLEMTQFATVFALLGMAVLTVVGMLVVVRLLAPSKPEAMKGEPYECGEEPLGSAWLRFNIRFFVVALVFVLFDVELALIYPVACIFRDVANAPGGFRAGLTVFGELFFFIGVLLLGLVYVWKKGDLGWIRSYRTTTRRGLRSWEQAAQAEKPEAGE
jgi:NADH-quinone oxidoreductase subunit A